jgi:hypothetical protein
MSCSPEDSLDLLERRGRKTAAELEIAVLRLPSLGNFPISIRSRPNRACNCAGSSRPADPWASPMR